MQFNDLRGSCVTALANAGCTPAEIAAVTGHWQRSVLAILDTDQKRTTPQASAAIAKLLQNACNTARAPHDKSLMTRAA